MVNSKLSIEFESWFVHGRINLTNWTAVTLIFDGNMRMWLKNWIAMALVKHSVEVVLLLAKITSQEKKYSEGNLICTDCEFNEQWHLYKGSEANYCPRRKLFAIQSFVGK